MLEFSLSYCYRRFYANFYYWRSCWLKKMDIVCFFYNRTHGHVSRHSLKIKYFHSSRLFQLVAILTRKYRTKMSLNEKSFNCTEFLRVMNCYIVMPTRIYFFYNCKEIETITCLVYTFESIQGSYVFRLLTTTPRFVFKNFNY